MVFHRFLEGQNRDRRLTITVNGEKVRPWNPFALGEPSTVTLPAQEFEVTYERGTGLVSLSRFVLPPRDKFSSAAEFERAARTVRLSIKPPRSVGWLERPARDR